MLLQEFWICTTEKKIVFRIQTSPSPETGRRPILLNSSVPILKAASGHEQLLFLFDTGNNKTDLSNSYYTKRRKEIGPVAVKDTITDGGFGFVRTKEILRFPDYRSGSEHRLSG